uniref:Reverse transcriptase Ty1/copia-type domain-containing protein n=1 Tax=Chromera velia CCMP2878 TaxID=1169474 RepID=A0A0G4HK05_9ALVE|eukprot:Cvel_28438.t1-p1 / transcript=Cvel_28438.t1 / gene=Cvel_28438 / organism=Chromera_velia_CCMP2878 / gene_product=hypothetical protein / transcript_product=hypothetical protein / location=Cvel_scaffold3724:4-4038(-) / protein_length=404 / sequence_SO=supercontig / SO=protein_coding / is_pseudo=false
MKTEKSMFMLQGVQTLKLLSPPPSHRQSFPTLFHQRPSGSWIVLWKSLCLLFLHLSFSLLYLQQALNFRQATWSCELPGRVPTGSPEGFAPGVIGQLERAMYGLKDAPRLYGKHFKRIAAEEGWEEIVESIFVLKDEKKKVKAVMAVHVDDLLIFSANPAHDFEPLRQRLKMDEPEILSAGGEMGYTSLEVRKNESGFEISQEAYLKSIPVQTDDLPRKSLSSEMLNEEREEKKEEDLVAVMMKVIDRLGRPRHLDFSVVGGSKPQDGGGPTLQNEYVVHPYIEGERLGPNEQKMEMQNGLGVEPYYKMVLMRVKPKATAMLKRSKEDPQKEEVYIDAIERNKYLRLFMTSDRRKEGGINEMGRPGMIELKEGYDTIVQDLLLPYVDIPMEGVFSFLSREAADD